MCGETGEAGGESPVFKSKNITEVGFLSVQFQVLYMIDFVYHS